LFVIVRPWHGDWLRFKETAQFFSNASFKEITGNTSQPKADKPMA